MDKDTQAKLEAALNRRATATTEAELKKAAAAKEDAERASKMDAARKQWAVSLQQIEAAISEVNARISAHGLQFKISETKSQPPAIAQLHIRLTDKKHPDIKERNLILNVSAYGRVQPVSLGPHTLGKIADFNVHEADQGRYEQVLTDYLALVFK
jgi:hypothetical protein